MAKVLVTGFTGNVGREVACKLQSMDAAPVCGVRNPASAAAAFGNDYPYVRLDFNDPSTYDQALAGVDRLFLMYPPETSLEVFHSFIRCAAKKGIRHMVYLSVLNVQFLPFIPHFKNERAIRRCGVPYTFLRAGYFTQNLNMFLLDELKALDRIYVPAGKGKTSFIDIRDVAEAAACCLLEGGRHLNQKYAITGQQSLDFYQVAELMSRELGRPIRYDNPSPKAFKAYMLEKGLEEKYLTVVTGLHIFTKIGMAKGITTVLQSITGRQPISVERYLHDYRTFWE